MAPALTIGLSGVPRSGSRRMELNASPVGSTPTTAATASTPDSSSAMPYRMAFEIDWTVNSTPASPTS